MNDDQSWNHGIAVLCKLIQQWECTHGRWPTRSELAGAFEDAGHFDMDEIIDRAIQAGAVEEIDGKIALTDFGEEVARNG